MKRCTVCKKEYDLQLFHKKAHSPDGRQTICKSCQRKKRKAKEQKNKEEIEYFSFY